MTYPLSRNLIAVFTITLLASCTTSSTSQDHPPVAQSAPIPKAQDTSTVAQESLSQSRCFYRGTPYSDGAVSCQSNMQYRCDSGEWVARNVNCGDSPIAGARTCQFSGISFSSGSTSCQNDTQYRCEDGVWQNLDMACSGGTSPIRVSPGARTCMFSGVTVASNSTVCKAGSTFLCSDGEWVNLGTLCR